MIRDATRIVQRYGQLISRIAAAVADAVAFPLAGLSPRDPDKWVFGHEGQQFAGNPKFLFLWLSQQRLQRVVWISGSGRTVRALRARGLPAVLRWSPAGIYHALTAGAVFFAHRTSDVNATLVNGAYLVNLWHGVGLKAIQLGLPRGQTSEARRSAGNWLTRARWRTYLVDPDIVVTTSDMMQAHFAAQFRLEPDRCPQLGYPRLDCACDEQLESAALAFDADFDFEAITAGFRRVIIYVPTFRDLTDTLLAEAISSDRLLEQALSSQDTLLFIKLHPNSLERAPHTAHIRPWPAGVDLQNYLHRFSALITDYSSILYDYLQVAPRGVPILYTFDFERYITADRSILYPFDENTAGLRVSTFTALCQLLTQPTLQHDSVEAERVRARFWGEIENLAAPRITEYVSNRLALSQRSSDAHSAGGSVAAGHGGTQLDSA